MPRGFLFISPITLDADQVWNNNSSGTLTVSGIISGSGGFTKTGSGTLILSAGPDANVYTGNTKVTGGILQLGTGWQTANNIPGGLSGTTGTAASNLEINGGTVTQYYYMTRTLGTGPTQIQITGGRSGFTNKQGDATGRNWRVGDNANYEIVWGSPFFNPSILVLQDAAASPGSATYTIDNKIDLSGSTRTIEVGASSATLSQIIRNTGGGSAGLIKTGSGILVLTNANTYNGPTTVSAGMLDFTGQNLALIGGGTGRNISAAADTAVRFNALSNAILNRIVETSAEFTVMTGGTSNSLDFSSSTGASLPNVFLANHVSNNGKTEYTGILTPNANTYRLGSPYARGVLGLTNVLSDGANPRSLIVNAAGSGAVILTAANTFSGQTSIRTGGKLILGNNLALQNSFLDTTSGTLYLSTGAATGEISNDSLADSPTFGGLTGSRALSSVIGNGTTGVNNTAGLAHTLVTSFILNPGTGKTYSYSGSITDFATGTTLTKTGEGTQILAGNYTYTGATTLSAGKLMINGNLSDVNAALTVAPGATLGGTGTVGRNVSIASGGKLEFDISTIAASHDGFNVSTGSSFAFSGASELTITSSAGAAPGIYTLVSGGNNFTGVAPATVNLPVGWAATISISGNSLLLTVTSLSGPGPVDHFAISSIGSTQTVGTPITGITITAQDSSNATATGFTGTVTFGGTGGFTGTSAAFTDGVLTGVSVTPTVAGAGLTFTVTDGASPTPHTGTTTITTIQTQYAAWAGASAFNGDSNGDGVENGLAWVLGAANPNANAIGLLPTVTQSGGNLTLTFNCLNAASRSGAVINIEHSGDLGVSDPWLGAVVPDTAGISGPVNGVTFDVTLGNPSNSVTSTISSTEAASGKIFGRLKAVQTP